MHRITAILLSILVISPGLLQPETRSRRFAPHVAPGVTSFTHTLRLADEKIWVHIYERPGSGLTFVNLHDNENTSVEAAIQIISRHGGRLVELRHGRGRNVVIRRSGVMNSFDPNRMFSEKGLSRSLAYSTAFSAANLALGTRFAAEVLNLIDYPVGEPLIAVHNNTQGKLTIRDFQDGGWYGRDTRDVNISPGQDADDFFFTNSPGLYAAVVDLGYNAALMADTPPDRGTLGCYINSIDGIYVNVETEHGHLKEQVAMLEDLQRLLTKR